MPRLPHHLRRGEKLALLASLPVLTQCRTEELVELGRLVELVTPRAGELIADPRRSAHWFGLVLSGHAVAQRRGVPDAVLGPGAWWGPEPGDDSKGGAGLAVMALDPMQVLMAPRRHRRAVMALAPMSLQPSAGFAPLKNRSKSPSTPAPWSVIPPSTTMV